MDGRSSNISLITLKKTSLSTSENPNLVTSCKQCKRYSIQVLM
jgi:hypothetical protein